ncbi:MAG: ABC transporter substrate-binding protein [Pseudomonadota bacterium]|jgi:ABC-type Fe3+-hydroxamate transport system substrate-binding protein|uniref:ABC transporter substrate-binding protein n=1 Tax=Burkholderiaceae TaxID=119060 RepID=UPI0010FA1F81|nr:ABC transporter substrate-binding protein [Burkholderia sp. 4M9327F10]
MTGRDLRPAGAVTAADPRRRRLLAKLGVFGAFGALGALGLFIAPGTTRAWAAAQAATGAGGAAGTAASATTGATTARASVPHRIVTLNWELTETLLALGVAPIGTALPDWYRRTIVEPPLPPGVADIGLLYQPNFEVLLALAPDLLIITPGHAPAKRWLERLAPTITLGAYMSSDTPYPALLGETTELAARLQRPQQASELISATGRITSQVRAQLAAHPSLTRAPVLVADLVDDRHLRVYAQGSLFDEMLQKLGVHNAANPGAGGNPWRTEGGFALVPVQRLAEVPQASLLLVGPVPPAALSGLEKNAIWQALPVVRERRIAALPVIAPYGGLVSMQRFAQAVAAALAAIDNGGGGVA